MSLDRRSSLRVLRIAAEETRRAMRGLRIPGHPRPFHVSCMLRDDENWRVQARYGSVFRDTHERQRSAFVDVRVGSWRSDQLREGGLHDNDKETESYDFVDLPYGPGEDGLRHGLWRLAEARYREAIESLLMKRSQALTFVDADGPSGFERRRPGVGVAWRPFPEVDRVRWTEFVERVSHGIRRYREVHDAHVEFEAQHTVRMFVDAEGSRRLECHAVWSLECYLWGLGRDGTAFPWTIKHSVTDPAELPDARRFSAEIHAAVGRLRALARAETVRSFCGPALLEPGPAGLLLHEAIGHRLEGNRLLCAGEGQTFKDSLGGAILPRFLSAYDDPRLAVWDGRTLVGHYRFDDEGVDATRADLVRHGELVGFLTTRTSLGPRHRSNGHARSRYHERPTSRMGVLVVEAHDGLDEDELKRVLLEEIRRQKAPFGVRIVEATSGETATDAYDFQAFLGEINLAAKVFPNGREQWIRGVNFVGTPLKGTHGIVAAGRRTHVDNSYCGAESGYVPVTTISPALVLSELELQSKPESRYTQFSLPLPWARGRGRGGKRTGRG